MQRLPKPRSGAAEASAGRDLPRRGARVRSRTAVTVDDASLPAPLLHAPSPLDLLLEQSAPGRLFRRTTSDGLDVVRRPHPDDLPFPEPGPRRQQSGGAHPAPVAGPPAGRDAGTGIFDAELIGGPTLLDRGRDWAGPGETPFDTSDLAALARAVRADDAPDAPDAPDVPDRPDAAEDNPFEALGHARSARAYFAPDAGADSITGDTGPLAPLGSGAHDGPPTEAWAPPSAATPPEVTPEPAQNLHIDLSDGPRLITRVPGVPQPRDAADAEAGPDEDTETIGEPVDLIGEADLTAGLRAEPRDAEPSRAEPSGEEAAAPVDAALLIPGLTPRVPTPTFVTPAPTAKPTARSATKPATTTATAPADQVPPTKPGPTPVAPSISLPRLPEPVISVTLSAVAALGVGAVDTPGAAWLPVAALLAVAPLSALTPDQPRLRVLRAGLMLAAAAALPLLAEQTAAIGVLIAVAAAGTYPMGLAEKQSRIVLGLAGAALVVPLLAGLLTEGADGVRDALPGRGVVQLCGVLVVLLVGLTAVSVRRALAATAELAVRREQEAADVAARIGKASATDAESGLPNRDALLKATTEALDARTAHDLEPSRDQVAVLIAEIDRFDVIADSLGAALADDVALQVARRLRSGLPAQQLVARLGRNRFGLLLPHATPDSCASVARRITRLMERPVVAAGREYGVTCSVGAALRGPGLRDAHDLLQAADEATRAATAAGTARWVLFDQAVRAAAHSRASLEIELRDVVRTGAIECYFQPLVALGARSDDGDGEGEDRIVGAEALARWIRSDGSSVPPATFIPVADELGVGATLGLQIADQALDALVAWREAGLQVDQVWMNVSPAQLRDSDLAHDLAARLATRGLPPSSLVVEVSAAHLVEGEQPQATLSMLRSMGIAVALDDFGRSGTSLSALRKLPVSAVKLDHVLAAELGRGGEAGDAVPRSIAQLCRSLGLRVIVEGVETMTQLRGAREIEADAVQGFAIARPLPSEDIVALLLKRSPARRGPSRSGSTAR